MTGRPCLLTPELQAEICGYIRDGYAYAAAARKAGIHAATFQRWRAQGAEEEEGDYRDFRDATTRARDERIQRLVEIVEKAAVQDARHAQWLLERVEPSEFGRKTRLEHAGRIDGGAQPHKVEITLHRPEAQEEDE